MGVVNISVELRKIAKDTSDEGIRDMAEKIADFEERRVRVDRYTPDQVLPVSEEWATDFFRMCDSGTTIARRSHVTICGMARNIGNILPVTISRLQKIGSNFADYAVVIVENDSEDNTKQVLSDLADKNPGRVVCKIQDFGWEHLHGFEASRVERYAILRNQYADIVKQDYRHTDFVLVVDLDCWGGWSGQGIANGIGWLKKIKSAACMASTSLFQGLQIGTDIHFGHYDTWALRVHGWREGLHPWKTAWLPPPGSPPIKVFSAFGAAAIYRPEAFFECRYESVDGDIEHAGLHRQMIEKGWEIYLNPAQRSLMQWVPDAEGEHGDD